MILRAEMGQPLPVYGTGENVRDWLHVQDHCRALDLILRKGQAGSLYHISGDCELRNIDLVKQICKILDKPEDLICHVEDRRGHDLRYALDASRLRRELGWSPRTTFSDGLRETVAWYQNHRPWLHAVLGRQEAEL